MSNDNSGWQGPGPGGDPGSQNRYYDRYWQASGEAITAPTKQAPGAGGGGPRGLLVAIVAVVVAVSVVATVVILKVTGGDEDPATAAQTSAAAQSTPSASTTPQLSWTNPAASVAPTAARPLKPIIATGDSSSYRSGFCKTAEGADLAFVGFYGVGQKDPGSAAPSVAQDFADAISLKEDNKTHAHQSKVSTKQTSVQGLPAVQSTVVATVGDRDKERCDSAKVEVRTMSASMGSKTTMLVLVRAIGVPKALPEKEAEAILHSVRPAAN